MNHLCKSAYLTAAVALALLAPATARAQDDQAFDAAKREFKRLLKLDDIVERNKLVERLRSTNDPAAIQVLLTSVHRVRKNLTKLTKKLSPLREKRRKYTSEITKRIEAWVKQTKTSDPTRVPAGLVSGPSKKVEDLTEKIRPLEIAYRLAYATKVSLMVAVGDLISSLDDAQRAEQTNFFLDLLAKVRKIDGKLSYLEILSYIRTPQAVLGLVDVASNDPDPTLRVGALNAISNIGDSRGAEAAVQLLDDDYWQVRAAAIAALGRFGSLDAIPKLIDRLEKEDGRLKGDVILALGSMTGVSFHDNVALWKKWWEESGPRAKEIMAALDSDVSLEQSSALERAADTGFLLAARRGLDERGLSLNAIDLEEAKRVKDPEDGSGEPVGGTEAGGVEGEEQAADAAYTALGRIIGKADDTVRARAIEILIEEPLARSKSREKRLALIEIAGHAGAPESAEILAALVKRTRGSEKQEDRRERALAARGLGFSARPVDLILLRQLFAEEKLDRDVLLAATGALAEVNTRGAVGAMVRALGEISSRTSDIKSEMAGVTKALSDGLRRITGLSHGDEYAAWNGWWRGEGQAFKTDRDEAAEKAGKGEALAKDEGSGTTFYGIKTYSKRVAFVLDVSGSMTEPAASTSGGGAERKIDVAKKELMQAIASLPKDAWFNIIFYSSDYRIWKKKLVLADAKGKAEARDWVNKVQAVGGTNIYDALVKAYDLAGRGTFDKKYEIALDTIYFLSDGQPTVGRITDPKDILREIIALNKLKKVQIHAIGVGHGHSAAFMKKLAAETGGTYVSR